jgi:hypothetical protein
MHSKQQRTVSKLVGFQVLTAATVGWKSSGLIAVMMEAVSTSVTSLNIFQTTRRKNPEDNRRQYQSQLEKGFSEPNCSHKMSSVLSDSFFISCPSGGRKNYR